MELLSECIRRASESPPFRLAARRPRPPVVREFMVAPVVSFRASEPLRGIMDVMLRRGVSGIVVTDENGRVEGIVSELDCMKLVAGGCFHHEHDVVDVVAGDVMTPPRALATPEMDLFAVVQLLLQARVRRAPVVEAERLVGIVSRRDVLRVIRDRYA